MCTRVVSFYLRFFTKHNLKYSGHVQVGILQQKLVAQHYDSAASCSGIEFKPCLRLISTYITSLICVQNWGFSV
jgi:hypothetical protein